jgi:hypothetical protein
MKAWQKIFLATLATLTVGVIVFIIYLIYVNEALYPTKDIPQNLYLISTAQLPTDTTTNHGAQENRDIFVPFEHISGINPGEAHLSDVIKLFGEPQQVKITEKSEVADIKLGGVKLIKYNNLGLTFLIAPERIDDADPIIDSVYAEVPYPGRSPNGIYLGMPREDALEICRRDYHQTEDLGSSIYFAKKAGGESDFQVWFVDDTLIRIKIFR